MSALLRSRALQSARTRAPLYVTRRAATTTSLPSSNASSSDTLRDSVDLKKVAKRDPELYVRLADNLDPLGADSRAPRFS